MFSCTHVVHQSDKSDLQSPHPPGGFPSLFVPSSPPPVKRIRRPASGATNDPAEPPRASRTAVASRGRQQRQVSFTTRLRDSRRSACQIYAQTLLKLLPNRHGDRQEAVRGKGGPAVREYRNSKGQSAEGGRRCRGSQRLNAGQEAARNPGGGGGPRGPPPGRGRGLEGGKGPAASSTSAPPHHGGGR
eukprot:GHVT01010625.1.p1 GENE.GHVT01010625.1~~GHVT01010625.1.p1  ORF type:complete len:188 (+),score=21.43 GHVT01010625.1:2610-3173(+)